MDENGDVQKLDGEVRGDSAQGVGFAIVLEQHSLHDNKSNEELFRIIQGQM